MSGHKCFTLTPPEAEQPSYMKMIKFERGEIEQKVCVSSKGSFHIGFLIRMGRNNGNCCSAEYSDITTKVDERHRCECVWVFECANDWIGIW